MHKYVIMGPQGSGKGTQARRLTDRFGLIHISVGDMFRWKIQNRTKMGARIKRIVASGQLVPDDVVAEVVRRRLDQHDWNYGFILDGFPRNVSQAEFFLETYDIDAVIVIDVPEAVVRERMMARRLCGKCGLDYNLIQHRPKVDDICDVCGGALVRRADDSDEAIRERLSDYFEKTRPSVELFRTRANVVEVDGTQAPDAVEKAILTKLGLTGA